MIVKCVTCNKEFSRSPHKIKRASVIYCSRECRRTVKQVIGVCPGCGKEFESSTAKKPARTCGALKCCKVRILSDNAKLSISTKLSKTYTYNVGYTNNCPICKNDFICESKRKKYCSDKCKFSNMICSVCLSKPRHKKSTVCIDCIKKRSSAGGLVTISKQITKSKDEIVLADYLSNHQMSTSNKTALDGFEIDILIGNLAIEYRGPWHYRKIMKNKTLEGVIGRDKFKEKRAKLAGLITYPVFWYMKDHEKTERLKIEAYYIDQFIKHTNGELTPWVFNYDRNLFKDEFRKLQETDRKSGPTCINAIDWYFKHIWSYRTSKHKLSSIEAWDLNHDEILRNRIKYGNLSPRSIRNYFRLNSYSPVAFHDSTAKLMANQITGNIIYDPFMGFGGRLLGTVASGRQYIGNDLDLYTVNANHCMAVDLEIVDKTQITRGDSSNKIVECDGVITSPPFYNKDHYSATFESIDHYKQVINDTFKSIVFKDKMIIDFKAVHGCTLEDFISMLPYKPSKVENINFNGLYAKSIHNWIYITR